MADWNIYYFQVEDELQFLQEEKSNTYHCDKLERIVHLGSEDLGVKFRLCHTLYG